MQEIRKFLSVVLEEKSGQTDNRQRVFIDLCFVDPKIISVKVNLKNVRVSLQQYNIKL